MILPHQKSVRASGTDSHRLFHQHHDSLRDIGNNGLVRAVIRPASVVALLIITEAMIATHQAAVPWFTCQAMQDGPPSKGKRIPFARSHAALFVSNFYAKGASSCPVDPTKMAAESCISHNRCISHECRPIFAISDSETTAIR